MPLKKGSSPSVVSLNIKTLIDDWKKDGAIGTSHPLTKKKAIKQDVAIVLDKAGKSRSVWALAFGLYAVRYWPVLTRPRLDGKPG